MPTSSASQHLTSWTPCRARLCAVLSAIIVVLCAAPSRANQPDSLFLFAYNDNPGGGLSLAYSADGKSWSSLCGGHAFVRSDYGAWGREKRMFSPSLVRTADAHGRTQWLLVFGVNDTEPVFGVCTSSDLAHWQPQDYPIMRGAGQCLEPRAEIDADGNIIVRFHDKAGRWYVTTCPRSARHAALSSPSHFSAPEDITPPAGRPMPDFSPETVTLDGRQLHGSINRIAWTEIEAIRAAKALSDQRGAANAETMRDDAARYAAFLAPDGKRVEATVTLDAAAEKPITDKLIGIFFEDINYSADGGLYAELVQNRDFEYSDADGGRGPKWNATHSWTATGDGALFSINTDDPVHPNQAHYAVLNTTYAGGSMVNSGYDGITLRRGETYDVSLFARQLEGKATPLVVELRDGDRVVGRTTLPAPSATWKRISGSVKATADAKAATLAVGTTAQGRVAMDIVSLFPRKTFRGRANGLRPDLAQTLADLHPRFMRFPGGCVAHGDGIGNIYNWKETVGPIETRKGARNLWGYHQTRGLGYYEYFLFCEDIGCEPLPVVAAGVPCQNSSRGGGGQQGGIPLGPEMDQYVQDVLDLIEWANGDPRTSQWARLRAEAGHPKPFNLKYIGIGNEDLISETFAERYLMIVRAVKARYPDIQVCGTVGPFFEGADYEQGWRIAKDNAIDMVDEHYYVAPGWFINNQDFYDHYDRSASKVYVGEYASHVPGRKSTIETALTCAMHICNLERNGDIVAMSSYAPLLAKHSHTQWNPDMIYFDNERVYPTVDYWAQMLCGQSQGDRYIPSTVALTPADRSVTKRIAVSAVRDSHSGTTYVKLVNLLPVAVETHLDLTSVIQRTVKNPAPSRRATIRSLAGAATDEEARPTAAVPITLTPRHDITLAPNSLTVITF